MLYIERNAVHRKKSVDKNKKAYTDSYHEIISDYNFQNKVLRYIQASIQKTVFAISYGINVVQSFVIRIMSRSTNNSRDYGSIWIIVEHQNLKMIYLAAYALDMGGKDCDIVGNTDRFKDHIIEKLSIPENGRFVSFCLAEPINDFCHATIRFLLWENHSYYAQNVWDIPCEG